MKEQLYDILEQLVIKNNIRVNQEELNLQLLSHPSYPSLHAFSGVLDHFDIDNLALRLPINIETLQQLPACWIAQIDQGEGVEFVLVEHKEEQYQIINQRRKAKKLSPSDFLKIWKGIILVLEKEEQSTAPQPVSSKKISQAALVLLSIFALGFFLYTNRQFFPIAHSLLSVIGLALSIFIVRHELGLQSAQADRLCNLSSKTSCDAVLQSEGATLFGLFKLSDISMLSFSVYLISWLLFALTGHREYSLIYISTLLAIPFTLYSLYYQAQVIKKWCPLCLGIVSVLVLQAITLLGATNDTFIFSWTSMLYISSSVLLSFGFWFLFRSLLEDRQAYKKLQVDHHKFKRNFSIFDALFRKEQSLPKTALIKGEIILGHSNAPVEITLITNPLCYYCKETHRAMEQILRQGKDQVKVVIRFSVNIADPDDVATQVASYLLHVYTTLGQEACLEVMHQVYAEQVNHEKWLSLQGNFPTEDYHGILNAQMDWCIRNGTTFTPVMYLNGKQYPKEYLKEDLVYFLEDLIESSDLIPTINQQTITASS